MLHLADTNVAGACTYTNASWQQIYGISLAESLGDGWSSALHPDDRESVFVEWQRTAAERIEFDKEFRIRHASGDIRHVHARAQALIESGEVVVGYVGSVQDVTQRVRAEQALKRNASDLRRSLTQPVRERGNGMFRPARRASTPIGRISLV